MASSERVATGKRRKKLAKTENTFSPPVAAIRSLKAASARSLDNDTAVPRAQFDLANVRWLLLNQRTISDSSKKSG